MTRSNLARAHVVSGLDPRRHLRVRLRRASRSVRPAAETAFAVAVGLWPIWVVSLFALGLTWVFALASSP